MRQDATTVRPAGETGLRAWPYLSDQRPVCEPGSKPRPPKPYPTNGR